MTTAPKLTRPTYHVWIAPEGVDPDTAADDQLEYHHVVINHSDQLRAELEARRLQLGSPKDSPMHLTSLWLWASLVRTGGYADKFQAFKTACVAYDPDRVEEDNADPVVPTAASTD